MRPANVNKAKIKRAVSGVVSLIMMSLVMVLFFAGVIYYTNALFKTQQLQEARTMKISEAQALARNVKAYWSFDPLTSSLVLNVTNHYSQPVQIPGAVIIYEDGSYEVWHLGHMLSPGETHSHSKNTGSRKPVSVRVTVSAGEGSTASIEATNETYGGTATPPSEPKWTPINLEGGPLINSPATTWFGTAIYYDPSQSLPGLPQDPVTYTHGTPVSGDAASLTSGDGILLVVDGTTYTASPTIYLEVNNTIVWDDFLTNPFASGRLLPWPSSSWQYDHSDDSIRQPHTAQSPVDIVWVNLPQYGASSSLPNVTYVMTKYEIDYSYWLSPSCGASGWGSLPFYFGVVFSQTTDTSTNYYWAGHCPYKSLWSDGGFAVITRKDTIVSSNHDSDLDFYGDYILTALLNRTQPNAALLSVSIGKYINPEVSSTSYIDPAPYGINYVGIGNRGYYQYLLTTYYPGSTHDFIYVVRDLNPRYVYIRSPTSDVIVEVLKGSSTINIVYPVSYDPSFGGFIIDLYSWSNNGASFKPFFDGEIRIRNSTNWALIATYSGKIMGGSVYRFIPGGPQARVSLTLDIVANMGSYGNVSGLELVFNLWSNVSNVDVTFEAYNRDFGDFQLVGSTATPASGAVVLPGPPDEYIGPHDNVTIRLNATGASAFRLFVDMLNIASKGPMVEGKVLLVGQADILHLYEVDTTLTPPNFDYLASLPAPPGIDSLGLLADLTVVYSNSSPSRVFVSQPGRGTFWADLGSSQWNPVSGPADGSIVETIDDGSTPGRQDHVLVINDAGTSWSYYVISYNGSVVPLVTTPPPVLDWEVFTNRTASAYTDWGFNTYVLAFNTSKSRPVVTEFKFDRSALSLSVKEVGELGFMNVVGMSPGPPGKIYIMQEGGPLHEMDVATGTVSSVPVALPFTPLGPGDRLELVGGRPFFLRAESSDQAWVLI